MIAKAIKTEHPRPRPLHLTVEHFFKGYPGLSMLVAKLGGVPAHPANVHRLLYDEEQLVLVFPEGRKGTEKLYKDRYRLRRFGRGGFVESAMRASAPIVPVAVVGAEEAMPVFGHVSPLQKLTGLIYFPITPTFPLLGLLGGVAYLPAKFFIRFLEPIPTDQWGDEPWDDKGLVQTVAEEVRARIQEELYEMLANRRSVWLGMKRRVLITGLSSYWGGRLAQELERDADVEVIIGVSPEDPSCALERTEYVRVGTQHALLRRIVHAAEIDTVIDTRLIVDSATAPPRVAHEMNVLGTMNVLAACGGPDSPVTQVRLQVLARTTTAASATTRASSPRRCSARIRRAPGWSPTSSRPSTRCRASPPATPKVTVTTLRFCNGLGPDLRTVAQRAAGPARGPRHPRLRPALPVHPRGRHRRRAAPRGASTTLPGIHNAAPDGVLALSEIAGLLGKPLAPLLPPWGTALATRGDAAGSASAIPDEVRQQLRYGRGLDNRKLKQSGYRFS